MQGGVQICIPLTTLQLFSCSVVLPVLRQPELSAGRKVGIVTELYKPGRSRGDLQPQLGSCPPVAHPNILWSFEPDTLRIHRSSNKLFITGFPFHSSLWLYLFKATVAAGGTAKGNVTIVNSQLQSLNAVQLQKLDLSSLNKQLELLKWADDNFLLHHQAIEEEYRELNKDRYMAEMIDNENTVRSLWETIKKMTDSHAATLALDELDYALEALEMCTERVMTLLWICSYKRCSSQQ